MGQLVFTVDDDFKSIYEHAKNAKAWRVPYRSDSKGEPCLFLVHDQGIYLMSGAEERQLIDGSEKCLVVYAQGCHPDKDADFWEHSRDLVGGDDFAEAIPLSAFEGIEHGAATIEITVGRDTISVEWANNGRAAPAR